MISDEATLELRLVGDVTGDFFVPRYQRGYRWGVEEVGRLLDDIWAEGKRNGPYCLQPVVVKKRPEQGDWELVDGQQRLTTLYLVLLYMQNERLQTVPPPYSITYQTRPETEAYFRRIHEPDVDAHNIDFHHLLQAYRHIQGWFNGHKGRKQFAANEFYAYLFKFVHIIWYEAPARLSSTELFTRLNIGHIPLTNAELVKAVMLTRAEGRAHELASQWDAIERDLRTPAVWAFVTDATPEATPTRISLLLDTVAGGVFGRRRPRFHTFDEINKQFQAQGVKAVWERTEDLHALILGWFDDRDLFHKVGFLIAATDHTFRSLVALAEGKSKSSFETLLNAEIRDALGESEATLRGLGYETDREKARCATVLLLMNVETVRGAKHSSEKYPFDEHHRGQWSLEHIHAQNSESLNRAEQWQEWLRAHRTALQDLPVADPAGRDRLVHEIDEAIPTIERRSFDALARRVIDLFTATGSDEEADLSVHGLSNLALLGNRANSALNNSAFEVKRRRVLELDKEGHYIPVCTRRVFLKYYTGADAQQPHFWSIQDRRAYLAEIVRRTAPYLVAEDTA